MNALKQIQKTFQNEAKGIKGGEYNYKELKKKRLIELRKFPNSITRLKKPSNLARARVLGYRAKQGYIVAIVKIRKGTGLHKRPTKGRRPKRMNVLKKTRKKSIQRIAEERASKKYANCEVLNSYKVASDGKTHFYEIILIDTTHPAIIKDKKINWIAIEKKTGRAERGLTSAGKKGRGLRKKGKGSEKARPSQKSKKNRLK